MKEPKFKVGDLVYSKELGIGVIKGVNKDDKNKYVVAYGNDTLTAVGDGQYLKPYFAQERENDVVNSPKHYTENGDNECIDVMRWLFGDEAVMAFCRCNIFKYRFRAGLKNGETDINKAVWYENYLHKMLQEQANEKDLR